MTLRWEYFPIFRNFTQKKVIFFGAATGTVRPSPKEMFRCRLLLPTLTHSHHHSCSAGSLSTRPMWMKPISSFAGGLAVCAFCCFVHALVPGLFTTSASARVECMVARMHNRGSSNAG